MKENISQREVCLSLLLQEVLTIQDVMQRFFYLPHSSNLPLNWIKEQKIFCILLTRYFWLFEAGSESFKFLIIQQSRMPIMPVMRILASLDGGTENLLFCNFFSFYFPRVFEEAETRAQSMLIKVSPLNGQKNSPGGHTYLSAVSRIW